MAFSIAALCIECHYAKCCYTESRVLSVVMLNVITFATLSINNTN
jgi:hypothetical protein